jgi:rhodanese-related sulfurtransferase
LTTRSHSAAVLLALGLGLSAAGCAETDRAAGDAADRLGQVAAAVARGDDRLDPARLAERIAARTGEIEILDLRSRERYAAGHIEGARHLPVAEALSPAGRADLAAAPAVVVYAEDTAPAAQAAVVLRLAGIEAYALDGGYRGWMTHLTAEEGPGARDPEAEARRLAAACRQSPAYAEARVAGFLPAAHAAEPSPAAAATPGAGETTAPPPPGAVPPPPPPPGAFTPPVAPLATPPAPPAGEGPGGLIVNEGC